MENKTTNIAKIPFLDLKKQYQQIKAEIFEGFQKVCEDTAFSGGMYVEQFENEFAQYCHTQYAMGLDNGTSALHLALLTLGIGQGDEVIIPANTFISTAWGVSYCQATPVFVDCREDTWEIDASQIESKITNKTKAIIGVHLYGQPFDIDTVKEVAKKYNLFLIEDAAQAHGAYYKGQRVGGLAEMACFSFYPGKNLGAFGEAGGITTNNQSYVSKIQSLRNHGMKERYYHDEIGYNMRMGGLEAMSLIIKLKYLEIWNSRRKEIAHSYQQGITNPVITMQKQPDFSDSVYHLFVITTKDRSGLIKYLNKEEIFPGMHYPVPCHLQKAYAHLNHKTGDFPNSEYLAQHCLSLPMYPELSNEEVERVINALNNYEC